MRNLDSLRVNDGTSTDFNDKFGHLLPFCRCQTACCKAATPLCKYSIDVAVDANSMDSTTLFYDECWPPWICHQHVQQHIGSSR